MVKNQTHDGRKWIGRVLRDKWRIDARLSRGGVGTVYAATHLNNGSRAAIKVLHPEFSRDKDTKARFLQEGYAANQVNHPGVVRILDDDTSEDGHAYLVMELLEGELLETRRIRKGGRLPLPDVFEIGEQLLDVLAAAHDKGIVHRDIKPDNLFITHEGRLKVLDFGFAQVKSAVRTEQTATGFLLGTPGFMSPEQSVGNRSQVDAQTDIWAVGATLFTLISGEPVHAGESAAEMLVAAANFNARSLATLTNGLNPRLVNVVDRALAFEKANRWPTARIMQLALREVAGTAPSGHVSRRSIPDEVPALYDDPNDVSIDIEELASNEYEVAGESWAGQPVERTMMLHSAASDASGSITSPSAAPPMRVHPADDDEPTLAGPSPLSDPAEAGAGPELRAARPVAFVSGGPTPSLGGSSEEEWGQGTLIMESPAAAPAAPVSGAGGGYGAIRPAPAPVSFGRGKAFGPATAPQPPLFDSGDSKPFDPSEPLDLSGPGAAREPSSPSLASVPTTRPRGAPRPGSSRILLFVAVAFSTMLVVIVAGLIILGVSD